MRFKLGLYNGILVAPSNAQINTKYLVLIYELLSNDRLLTPSLLTISIQKQRSLSLPLPKSLLPKQLLFLFCVAFFYSYLCFYSTLSSSNIV